MRTDTNFWMKLLSWKHFYLSTKLCGVTYKEKVIFIDKSVRPKVSLIQLGFCTEEASVLGHDHSCMCADCVSFCISFSYSCSNKRLGLYHTSKFTGLLWSLSFTYLIESNISARNTGPITLNFYIMKWNLVWNMGISCVLVYIVLCTHMPIQMKPESEFSWG